MDVKGSKKRFFFLFWAFYALLFFILLKHSGDYLDPDFGWHMKFGQEVAISHDVPRINSVNYTLMGEPLVDHEWLSNLLTYEIFDEFGYFYVCLFFAALAALAFLVQYLTAKRFFFKEGGSGLWVLFAFQLFAVYASLPSLGVRMQEFTLLFLAVLLYVLYEYGRTARLRTLLVLPPLFYFWSCLHGGFLLGLLILFLFPVVKSLEVVAFKSKRFSFLSGEPLPMKAIGVFLFWATASLSATFLTPYGWELYSFLASYQNDFYLGRIFEWFHQFRYPFFYQQLVFLQLSILILTWWGIRTFWLKGKPSAPKIGLWDAFLMLLFLIMAVKSRRHFPLLAIFSVPILSSLSSEFLGLKGRELFGRLSGDRRLDLLIKIFLTAVFLCGLGLQLVAIRPVHDPWKRFDGDYPYQAVQFLKEHSEYRDKRLFNEFNWGGYLIWTYPGKELFIDGRLPQMRYNGHSLLEEFYDFFIEEKVSAKLDEHGIEMVMLSAKEADDGPTWWEERLLGVRKKERVRGFSSSLEEYLSKSSEWTLVHADEVAKIFVKND